VTLRENRVLVDGEVIEGTTKTSKTRTIRLDRRTVTALKSWKTRQAQERMAAGPGWAGGIPGKTGYLWTDETGAVYRPDELSDFFEQAQAGIGLPRLVFHGLRHTSATIALARFVPVHVVSARLGHANVSITWNIYAHVIPGQDGDAAAAIGDAIYGATGTDDAQP
jgi:integrase